MNRIVEMWRCEDFVGRLFLIGLSVLLCIFILILISLVYCGILCIRSMSNKETVKMEYVEPELHSQVEINGQMKTVHVVEVGEHKYLMISGYGICHSAECGCGGK